MTVGSATSTRRTENKSLDETKPSTTTTGTTSTTTNTTNTTPATNPTVRTATLQTAAEARAIHNHDPVQMQLSDRIRSIPIVGNALAPPPDGGASDEFPADGTVDQAKTFMQSHQPTSQDPAQWTVDQREAFNVLAADFGTRHQEHHEAWHTTNGAGGTRGPGSGEEFLQFHRDMMRQFEEETGVKPPSGWDPSSPIPTEFKDPDPNRPRVTNDADVERPAWLTADGEGTTAGNRDFGSSVTIDGTTFNSLDDFQNPDQLGRALGESGYHASVHSRIGGTMGGFASPRDPAFYAWHGHVDKLVDEWLQTSNGKAWAAANPTSPLLAPASNDHHH